MQSERTQTILKIIGTVSIVLFSISLYITFGFFFDVFLQAIPILFLPIAVIPFIYRKKHVLRKRIVICIAICLILLSIAMSVAVGIVGTSKPAQWQKPCCGSVRTIHYSKDYMRKTYDIDQRTEIKIWLPKDYCGGRKYPVLYVLDGDMLFNYSAVKAAQYCESGQGDIIVVGIGYGYWNSSFARGALFIRIPNI